MPATHELDAFFAPRGVVVVGVSSSPHKLGYGLARSLVQSGYPGAIYFVNPKGGTLFGRSIFTEVAAVPDPIDLAVLIVAASNVPQALEECGKRGIPAAIISSGGFREVGETGLALEKECLRIAKKYNMRLLGPNCIGILDAHLPLDTTFLPPPGPQPGDIAFISQSGAICAAVSDWSQGQGFGFSRLVSLGNQADVTESDVLLATAADQNTHVLSLYLEGVSDGQKFLEAAAEASRQKPVIALKVGRFEGGHQAVSSHTGALAGQESAYDAAFRRAGVLRAKTTEEMFDWARALAWCPLPKGGRVAVLTNAGGPGVTAADAIEANGLSLAKMSDASIKAMVKIHPSAASLYNPIDMLASASPEQYAESLRIVLADPGVDSVIVILPPPPVFTAAAVAGALIPVIQEADKPVVLAVMGHRLIGEALERLRAAHIPDYRFPENAAGALAALYRRAQYLNTASPKFFEVEVDKDAVAELLENARPDGQGFFDQRTTHQILMAYGLPVVEMKLACDADQAVTLADEIGYPVVLKVAAEAIPHKSDVGGVLLGLADATAVQTGFTKIMQRVTETYAEDVIEGVYVQRMLPEGQEVVVGAVQDAQFGGGVMFGSGGVEVEGLKDVAFALAPLTVQDADYLLANTWAGRKLAGFRSLPPADRGAVIDVLTRVAQLVVDFPQIKEMDINPLCVLPVGAGAYAIDVRLRV